MRLNKNSFILWDGAFNEAPYVVAPLPDVYTMQPTDDYILCAVLSNDQASYGINPNTVKIIQQANSIKPATWDIAGQVIKFFAPRSLSATKNDPGDYFLSYNWKDNIGHQSGTVQVQISVPSRTTGWRVDPTSYSCQEPGGVINGYAGWERLERYYTDDNTAFLPRTTKNNVFGDPDYVAPVLDPVLCPLPTSGDRLTVHNMGTTAVIETVTLRKAGFPPEVFNVSVGPNSYKEIRIKGGAYEDVEIQMSGDVLPYYSLDIITPPPGATFQSVRPVTFIMHSTSPLTFGSGFAGEIIAG